MSDRHSMAIRRDARQAGMVTAQTTRVRAPWSTMRTRAVGLATGTTDTSQGSTVRVRNMYDDSVDEVRTVSSFRKDRPATKATKVTARRRLTEVERMGLVNNIGADFS